ncbi:UNVERIFIED_CONTAM: hypothetical protein Sindi_1285800 [Sesamum indicum]
MVIQDRITQGIRAAQARAIVAQVSSPAAQVAPSPAVSTRPMVEGSSAPEGIPRDATPIVVRSEDTQSRGLGPDPKC